VGPSAARSGIGPRFLLSEAVFSVYCEALSRESRPVARKGNSQHGTDDAKSPDQVWSSPLLEHITRGVRRSLRGHPCIARCIWGFEALAPCLWFSGRPPRHTRLPCRDGLATPRSSPGSGAEPATVVREPRRPYSPSAARVPHWCNPPGNVSRSLRGRRVHSWRGLAQCQSPVDSLDRKLWDCAVAWCSGLKLVSHRRNQLRNRFKAIVLTHVTTLFGSRSWSRHSHPLAQAAWAASSAVSPPTPRETRNRLVT
jgi:hypothetical protein